MQKVLKRARTLPSLTRVAALLGLGLAACTTAAPERLAPEAPSPLVLSAAEKERALALAEEARYEIEVTAPPVPGIEITREIVAAVGLYPPTDESDRRRLAAVTSFDYRSGQATRVVVDLGAGRVLRTDVLPGASAPVAPEEVARARELLAADSAAYRALFEAPEDSYDLGTFVSVDEEGELAGHRILLVRPVYFRPGPRAPIAIIDLSADRVLRYED